MKNVLAVLVALVLIACGLLQLQNDPAAGKNGSGTNNAAQPKGSAGKAAQPQTPPAAKPKESKPTQQPAKNPAESKGVSVPKKKLPAKSPAPTRGPPSRAGSASPGKDRNPGRTAKRRPSKPAAKSTAVLVRLRSGKSIDVGPTLARIKRGEKHPHRNDGSVFGNYEKRLPRKPRGYYREYVHPTPGKRGPGARRLVIGKRGEVYYTHDHYKSFTRVKTK